MMTQVKNCHPDDTPAKDIAILTQLAAKGGKN